MEWGGEKMTLIEAATSSPERLVRRKSLDKNKIFRSSGLELIYVNDAIADDWEPIIEKKKKTVVMYQAVFGEIVRGRMYISERLFFGEEDAEEYCKSFINSKLIKLLTDRPIEVEVTE